jgi:DNA helicase HerA-like ATPase
MKIYIGRNLKNQNIYWNTKNRNFLYIAALSGGGKSYLANQIIDQFILKKYKVYIISEKARVDYKQDVIKVSPLDEHEALRKFISEIQEIINNLKVIVENSKFSHINETNKNVKLVVILDELWSTDKLPKDLKADFNNLIELIIRQGRYLNLLLIGISQTFKANETDIPIKQASVIIIGKTDTKEASLSVLDNTLGYTAPLRTGQFIYWQRGDHPVIVSIKPEFKSFFRKLWNFLRPK